MIAYTAPNVSSRSRGFSMTELLIVVFIVAILTAVALPSYFSQVQKSRRAEAKAALTQLSSMQEQFRTEQNRYATDLTELGLGAAGWNDTENGYYEISVVAPDGTCPIASCYHLQVRRKSGSVQADDPWDYELWSDGRKRRRSGTSAWISDWKK